MALPIGKNLSHYRILEQLGAGEMGEVYLAHDTTLHREVAIKVLPNELAEDPDRLARLRREARVLASLNHPNIATIYGLEEPQQGSPFLVLERIEGDTLAARLKRGLLPVAEALAVCAQIAEALATAHERGVIHRDLKPRNVMLTFSGQVKLLDFGLAKRARAPAGFLGTGSTTASLVTGLGVAMGTIGYASPEQIRAETHDKRTDIFSFGCVLYECLTGLRAFGGNSAADVLAMTLTGEPVWSALPAETPTKIRDLLSRCLEKNPERRLRDIGDARLEIEEARGTRSPTAPAMPPLPPNNLPKERTHFIGREKELGDCVRIMADTRLLTLTGVGGCGKTRMALKLAESLLEAYPDGVWFVNLAPLADPARVALAVAMALDVREEPGTPLLDTLCLHLRDTRVLIVLDNCEHVIGMSAEVSDALLSGSRSLKLIATSREGLGIEGERSFAIRSLSIPSADAEHDLEAIGASEAVRLFVDRARTADAEFELSEKTGPVVAEICRRLDGIPLALELAAARVKILKVEEIRSRLDDRFRLLTGGSRALPRHQTLRATMQWSHDQLAAEEQRLFRLLSVFAGGWTLEASGAVMGEDADGFEVLDLLSHLGDKSLVSTDHETEGVSRYSMLETVRQYAQERLNESGEGDGARTRHLDFYLALAEEAEAKLAGSEQGAWFSRLTREHENLLLAHRWCDGMSEGVEKGLRLVGALRRYWLFRGLPELGHRITVEGLMRPGSEARSPARSRALFAAGYLGYFMGRYAEAKRYGEESLSIAIEIGEKDNAAAALYLLGSVSHAEGDLASARRGYEESLALGRELKHRNRIGAALNALAEVSHSEGDLEAAKSLYEESLAAAREQGDLENVAIGLLNLATVSIALRWQGRARIMLLEALTIVEEIGAKWVGQNVLDVCAGLWSSLEEWRRATLLYGASEGQMEQMRSHREPADEQSLAALMARAREGLGDDAFATAEAEGRAFSYEGAMAQAREWLEHRWEFDLEA